MKYSITKILLSLFSILSLISCTDTSVQTENSSSVSHENNVILVTGITGNQGGGVADALLEQGFKVRGLSRNIESDASKALTARGVEMVQGDFTKYDTINAAVAGIDGIFINITERTDDYINAANHAIDAAYAAGAEHVVFTSNIPADTKLGFEVSPERTKRMIELHLRASGGSYTTLRIPFMMENLMRERGMREALEKGITDYGDKETLGYYISSGDMGLLAAAAFSDPDGWNRRELNMASDAISYRDLAALLTKLSGSEIGFKMAPWSEMQGRFAANFQFFETLTPDNYDMDLIRAEFPQMKTVEQYLVSQGYGEKFRALVEQ